VVQVLKAVIRKVIGLEAPPVPDPGPEVVRDRVQEVVPDLVQEVVVMKLI
tara:strand:- start:540 stop:689 length:150 start_codon:yes stop_codon:yes gene_type:complete